MIKKIAIGTVFVFVLKNVMEFLINNVILMETYQNLSGLWRPMAEMQSKFWILYVVGLIESICFTYIFSRGWEGRGILEGVRYGALVGLMVSIPGAYMQYVVYPLPYHLVLQWGLYGLAEFVVIGMSLSLVFGKKA